MSTGLPRSTCSWFRRSHFGCYTDCSFSDTAGGELCGLASPRASHCRMDRTPNHGGLRLGGRAELSGSCSGPALRRGIYPTHSSDGHSRQTDSAAISLAERLCRTTDRLDQTRMPGSRDHNWRATPAPYPAFVPAILQRHPNAPVIGQGLTANEIRPGGRSHSSAAGPRRIAPSLRPNLIFARHNGEFFRMTSNQPRNGPVHN